MVEIKFLGGCFQIGGSAIAIESPSVNLLMDYGVIMEDPPKFPQEIRPKELDAILLTHAHLDHSGGIPLLFSGMATPQLFTTSLTLDITQILIQDFIRISEYYLPFGKAELLRMTNYSKRVSYGKRKITSDCVAHFLDAGHIPGSLSIYLELDGKKILYTGDFNSSDTQLLNRAQLKMPKLDGLIIESTYALNEHPDREEVERKFVERATQIVENGGNVLVPAFGVARSQEILCTLFKHNFHYPVFMDGMARVVARIFSAYPHYFRNFDLYKKALKQVHLISQGKRRELERSNAMSTPSVIIAPSGMLKGGTAVNYTNELFKDSDNGIFLVSFQIQDTPGRILLESKKWGEDEANCQIEFFDFSSHAGRTGLWELIHSLEKNPDLTVYCIHGEAENCKSFAKDISETTALTGIAPKVNESFKL